METLGLGLLLTFQDHASGQIRGVLGLLRQLRDSINRIGSVSGTASAGMRSIASAAGILGSALSILGGIATGVFANMIIDITKAGMQLEGMLTTLDQMLGSKPKAMKQLLDFEQVAARTPLTFQEVANAGTQLAVVGLDPMKTYTGTWKAHRKSSDGKQEGTYESTLLEALGDLAVMRPDKGISTAIREGKEFVEGQSRPLKMSYGLSTQEILGEKMAATAEERAEQLIRMLGAANILGGMERAGQNLHTILQNLKSDIELFTAYMTLPEEAGAGGFLDYIKEPFKDLFEYLKEFTKQRDVMSKIGKSWAEGFKIVATPARELIRLFGELIRFALEFAREHPKIVSFGIAFAGIASQILLVGGALLATTALFNLFRARILGGVAVSQFLRNALIAMRMNLLLFARAIAPTAAALGFLYYAFRTNLLGIRSLVDTTLNYVSNFFSVLFDAMTHYDLETGLFRLSRANYNLAQEMGILDFISAIVTAEGYVLRFWEGFKRGVAESQASLDAMSNKVTEFLEKMGVLKKERNEEKTSNSGEKNEEQGTYINPIKRNVIYNRVFDQNIDEVGGKIGRLLIPLTLLFTGIRAVTFVSRTLTTVFRGLGSVINFLRSAIVIIGSLFGRLANVFRVLINPIRGALSRFGTFLFNMLTRPLTTIWGIVTSIAGRIATVFTTAFSTIGNAINFIITPFRALWTAISTGFSAGGISGMFSSVGRFFANIARYLLTSIPLVGRFIRALLDIRRVFGVVSMLRTLLLGLRFAMATNPIGLALLAIGLAAEFVISHWEQFEQAASSVWNHVTSTVEQAWERIKTAFEPALEAMSSAWDTFAEAFPGAAEAIASVFGGLVDIFSADADTASAIFNVLGTAVKIAFDVVIFAIEAASSVISGIIQIIVGTFEGLIKFIKAVFTGDFSGALDAITGIVRSWGSGISTIVGGIASAFEGLIGRIKAAIDEARGLSVTGAASGGSSKFNALKGYAEGGIITNPEVAIIGEAGQEVIVPVTRNDSRSKWLARYAAEKTGIISDIVANAQTKNNPVLFEVRGMEPVQQETAVLGAYEVSGLPSVPNREELSNTSYLRNRGNTVPRRIETRNPEPYLPGVTNQYTINNYGNQPQEIMNSSVVREFVIEYNRQNTRPQLPVGGNVPQEKVNPVPSSPLDFIAREQSNIPLPPQEMSRIISDVVPVIAGNIDIDSRPAIRREEGRTGYDIVRAEQFFSESEGLEVLIPTVIQMSKGIWKIVDKNEAIRHYMETGEHLGKFRTVRDAEIYAKALSVKENMAFMNPNLQVVPNERVIRTVISSPNNSPRVPLGEGAQKEQSVQPQTMTELSGVPALDKEYLKRMTSNPVRSGRKQILTEQPIEDNKPPVLGGIFNGLGFFGENISNILDLFNKEKKQPSLPDISLTTVSGVDNSPQRATLLGTTQNIVSEERQGEREKPNLFDRITGVWKDVQREIGNFFGGIFGFRKKKEEEVPPSDNSAIIPPPVSNEDIKEQPPVISPNGDEIKPTENPPLGNTLQEEKKKKPNLWDKFVGGWKSLQRNIGKFLGFGKEESDETGSEILPKPVDELIPMNKENKSMEQSSSNPVREINNSIPSEDVTFRNTRIAEKSVGIVPDEKKEKPNLWDKINSSWVSARDWFSTKILGRKRRDDDETGSVVAGVNEEVQDIQQSGISPNPLSNPRIPLQQVQPTIPVMQPFSFSGSVQFPQQQQSSQTGRIGGARNESGGETYVFNEGAIKIEIKDAVDAKKIVPIIKKEIERLRVTRQGK